MSALLLTTIIFAAPITTEAAEIIYNGTTGNCEWELDANGVLTISGYGAMDDYLSPYSSYFFYTDMRSNDLSSITTIIIRFGVTSIGNYSFRDCTNLKSVTIPNSVTKIGHYAFENCTSLTNISIPNSVTEIGTAAFHDCSSLASVTIPNSVVRINDSAFTGCTNLTGITIPDSVVYLGSGCFSCCSGLQHAVIGNTVKDINDTTFYCCSQLTDLSIGKSVKAIYDSAFAGCTSLPTVTVPDSVETIGNNAFSGCTGLTSLSLGKSVKVIDQYAFVNCTSLKSVEMGYFINSIGIYAFHGCNSLRDIYYGADKRAWKKIVIQDYNLPLTDAIIHYEGATSQNVIVSDYRDNHNFTLNKNEVIEDLVLSQPSDTYSPRLSHFLACMARSAYTSDLVHNNYFELDFENIEQYHYGNDDPIAAFTIGEKNIDNNNKLVMITIRGSADINDWLETNFNLGNDSMIYSHGWHSGFSASAEETYNELMLYLGGIQKEGVTYVITGHSLGAAVGNLLAIKLFEAGISSSRVYDYNFACPNVAMGPESSAAWNYQGRHNNIINIGNWCDYVTHVPAREWNLFRQTTE